MVGQFSIASKRSLISERSSWIGLTAVEWKKTAQKW